MKYCQVYGCQELIHSKGSYCDKHRTTNKVSSAIVTTCFLAAALLGPGPGCTPAERQAAGQKVIEAAPVVTEATCKALDMLGQDEPAFIKLACEVLDSAGKVKMSFKAKVPKDAANLARCPKKVDGGMAP